MIKKRFVVDIIIDENTIPEKYSNYKFNHPDLNSLIQSIIHNIPVVTNIDMSKEDSLETNGIEIKVMPFIYKENRIMTNKELDIAQKVLWELILEHQYKKRTILEQNGFTNDTNPFPLRERERYIKIHDCYTILEEERKKRLKELK
jgi:hypothetical protein